MKKLIMSGIVVAALAAPAPAAAQDPTPADFKNASKYCKDLKKRSGSANFASMFRNHGKCVSTIARQTAREDAQQERQAQKNASQQCRDERSDPNFAQNHNGQSFAEFYGTNRNGKNAFGKCVSSKAKQNKAEADEQDKQEQKNRLNAARQCRAEQKDPNFAQSHGGESFAEFYGTNRNNRNAFGKCVSGKARGGPDQYVEQS